MTPMVLSTPKTKSAEPLWRVNVHIEADVLPMEVARRKANVWLLANVGNLLGAENPELIIKDKLMWRVDVILTSPTRGHLGKVGSLCLDAVTGEALPTTNLIDELTANAEKFVSPTNP